MRSMNGSAKSASTSSSVQSWRIGSGGVGLMGATMPEGVVSCQRNEERQVDNCSGRCGASMPQQLYGERDRHAERSEHRHQHGPRGAVLDEADARMLLRAQVIGELLERGVEELGGEHQ